MNIKNIQRSFFAIFISAFVFILAACNNVVSISPSIVDFTFTKAENSFLSNDVKGSINTSTNTITLTLDESVLTNAANLASLVPTITCSKDASIVGSRSKDFTHFPVSYVVTTPKGETATYLITLSKKRTPVSPGALLFTEYYSGLLYNPKGANNQYLEITNMSNDVVDLGACHLKKTCWENGKRNPLHDQDVVLSGTLASGASLVVYSNRITFTGDYITNGLNDSILNTIISFNGYDGFTLTSANKVLDVLGPNGGMGNGWNWGAAKLMQRKSSIRQSDARWDESQWITTIATNTSDDAKNAGKKTEVVSSDAKDITYFAFEELKPAVYGSIKGDVITVNVKESYGTILKPTVSTNGYDVRYNGLEKIISGETEIDFSSATASNPFMLKVYASDSSEKNYKVIFNTVKETVFTEINYDFDGGIKPVLDAIKKGEKVDTTVEGILTAKNIYGHKTAKKCYFIQDKNAALYCFVKDEETAGALPSNAIVGNKVRVTLTDGGSIYFEMPQASGITSCELIDDSISPIYYKTGQYSSDSCKGLVYEYVGTVEQTLDSHAVGCFSASENLYFHADFELKNKLAKGTYGRFYGPILFAYDQYRLEINDESQIKAK